MIARPSQLGREEIARWREIQRLSPHLHRAFLSPTFSLACEAAGFDTRVAAIRRDDVIEAFFPFQYHDRLHKFVGLAEAIGGHLSDASGVVAEPGWKKPTAELMALCGLAAIHVNCLADGQSEFGLEGYQLIPNYVVDLSGGYQRYMEDLQSRNADFVRDTGRRFRRATRSLGDLVVRNSDTVDAHTLDRVILQKRAQYMRTNTGDALKDVRVRHLLEFLASQNDKDCGVFYTALEAGGEVVAEHLGLRYFDALSYWFPVYDVKFQQYSPGRLILWELIKGATENGITLIDFGEGESQYKRQFSNKLISSHKAYWEADSFRSNFARMYQSYTWRAQSLSRRVRTHFSTQGS